MQEHDKIIRDVAREILGNEGLFQVGQSRSWLDDQGFFMGHIEFQPSGYDKGSYLNTGVCFLWSEPKAADFNVDSFEYGDRAFLSGIGEFAEYRKGKEESFRQKVMKQAEFAKEQIFEYRNFRDFEYAERVIKNADSSYYDQYHLAMLNFFFNNYEEGRNHFIAFIEELECNIWYEIEGEVFCREWAAELCQYCKAVLLPQITDADSARRMVINIIKKNRKHLCSKTSYKEMDEVFSEDWGITDLDKYGKTTIETVQKFVAGKMPILEFVEKLKESEDIVFFLESIVNDVESGKIPLKRQKILDKFFDKEKPTEFRSDIEEFIKEYAQSFVCLSDEWKANPPRVGEFLKILEPLTSYGAVKIHGIVSDIYYQVDPGFRRTSRYMDEYGFSIDVLPGYLAGGISAEAYVSEHIMPKYPITMKKSERKKLVREEVKQAFRREGKGYPWWLQSPEWPMDEKGQPMIFVNQKSFGDYREYYFHRVDGGEVVTVTQWW